MAIISSLNKAHDLFYARFHTLEDITDYVKSELQRVLDWNKKVEDTFRNAKTQPNLTLVLPDWTHIHVLGIAPKLEFDPIEASEDEGHFDDALCEYRTIWEETNGNSTTDELVRSNLRLMDAKLAVNTPWVIILDSRGGSFVYVPIIPDLADIIIKVSQAINREKLLKFKERIAEAELKQQRKEFAEFKKLSSKFKGIKSEQDLKDSIETSKDLILGSLFQE